MTVLTNSYDYQRADFCDEALALFARYSPQATYRFRVAINRAISSMIAVSIWPKLDYLTFHAPSNSEGGIVNAIHPSQSGTLSDPAPVFNDGRGFQGQNGREIITPFNPGDGGTYNFQRYSHTVGVLTLTNDPDNGYDFATDTYGVLCRLSGSSNEFTTRGASGTPDSIAPGQLGAGLYGFSRNASNKYRRYQFGVLTEEVTRTATATVPNQAFRIFRRPGSGSYSNNEIFITFAGGYFDDTDWLNMQDILTDLQDDMDAHPVLSRYVYAGAPTDDGFQVRFDCTPSEAVSVAIFSDESLTVPVATTPEIASVAVEVRDRAYVNYSGADITGLAADTDFWYAPKINGVIDTANKRRARTVAAPGAVASYSILAGSCSLANSTIHVPAFEAMSLEGDSPYRCIGYVHLGDRVYSDIVVNSVQRFRRTGWRQFRQIPEVEPLHYKHQLIAALGSDHCAGGGNDGQWDKVFSSGATYKQILTAGRQNDREVQTYYPFPQVLAGETDMDKVIWSQVRGIGRVKHIFMDTQAYRRFLVGTPTLLGHNSGHEDFDQLQWVIDETNAAPGQGYALVVWWNASTWIGAVYGGWEHHWMEEKQYLLAQTAGVNRLTIVGDAHEIGFSNSDIPMMMFSPLRQDYVLSGSGPYLVDGISKRVYGNADTYGRIDFQDTGSSIVVTGTAKGSPFDGSGNPTTLMAQAFTFNG